MKMRYKVILVVGLFWIGMVYESMRVSMPLETVNHQTQTESTIAEQIELYEEALVSGATYQPIGGTIRSSSYQTQNSVSPREHYPEITDNIISRTSRNIGIFSQTLIRETLRSFVIFFDGLLS